MTQFNTGPAKGIKPVAWIRAHPDGTLSYDSFAAALYLPGLKAEVSREFL